MSQADALLELFRENGGRLTLGQILARYDLIGSKYTNRLFEVRQMGYRVECIQNHDRPTENVYILHERPYVDNSGQSHLSLGA